jgi:RNA polymerase sigma-70 factor (ECF subfamily)
MSLNSQSGRAATGSEFESQVSKYYTLLYRFAFSLTRSEADACDLTQQTFLVWGQKGHQLRDRSKVKSWLFTTLHREFLKMRRQTVRFPQVELSEVESELPGLWPDMVDALEVGSVLEALSQVDPVYQAPITLFYLEELSYEEIAKILDAPIGTIQSRLHRGKAQLQRLLARAAVVSVGRGS